MGIDKITIKENLGLPYFKKTNKQIQVTLNKILKKMRQNTCPFPVSMQEQNEGLKTSGDFLGS